MNKYYFTFGSHSFFPYQNGYVIVKADTLSKAIEKFRSRFPDRHLNTVNCSFWYTEEEWRNTAMSSDKRYKCYEVIE